MNYDQFAAEIQKLAGVIPDTLTSQDVSNCDPILDLAKKIRIDPWHIFEEVEAWKKLQFKRGLKK